MVNYESCNFCFFLFRMDKEKWNVSFIVFYIGNYEVKGNDDFFIKDDNIEVWVL